MKDRVWKPSHVCLPTLNNCRYHSYCLGSGWASSILEGSASLDRSVFGLDTSAVHTFVPCITPPTPPATSFPLLSSKHQDVPHGPATRIYVAQSKQMKFDMPYQHLWSEDALLNLMIVAMHSARVRRKSGSGDQRSSEIVLPLSSRVLVNEASVRGLKKGERRCTHNTPTLSA